jgi:hypothetical protein
LVQAQNGAGQEDNMNTIKTLIITALLITAGTSALANSVEFDQRGDCQQAQICLDRQISSKVGVFAYNCLTKNWREGYVGLTYSPKQFIQVAYGIGQETGGFRQGGWIWAGKGRISAIYLAEDGASGPWNKTVVKYQATKRFALGWTEKSFAGSGIYAEYSVNKTITVKFSGFKTPEFGIKASF